MKVRFFGYFEVFFKVSLKWFQYITKYALESENTTKTQQKNQNKAVERKKQKKPVKKQKHIVKHIEKDKDRKYKENTEKRIQATPNNKTKY